MRVHIDDVYGPTGRFDLRVGVYFAQVRKLLSRHPLDLPTAEECTVRKRFGPDAAGASLSVWIVGDPKHPGSVIKSELASIWQTSIEPWLAVAGDLRALHLAIEEGSVRVPERLVPVAIALSVDDKPVAQRRFEEALRQVRAELAADGAGDRDGDEDGDIATVEASRVLVDMARLAAVHGLVDPGGRKEP